MNLNEFNEIYKTMLKRNPNDGDIKAHIHKNKDMFILEVKTCREYLKLCNNLVSIILPTKNRLSTFRRAIESCLNQTYRDIEVIVCDDSDNDTTYEYYKQSLQFPNVTYIKNKTTLGFCKNINQGLRAAKGAYVTMLFDDDYYYNTYIDKTMAIFKTNDVGFVTTAAHNFYKGKLHTNNFKIGDKLYAGKLHKYDYYNGVLNLYRNNFVLWSVSPCNYVFRNNKILLRESLYENFDARQLMCGAGYDLLFILDNLKYYDYFFVNTTHLVYFDSTQGSFTVDNTDYVIGKLHVAVKYWVEHELTEQNILLKLDLMVRQNINDVNVLGKMVEGKINVNNHYIEKIKKFGNLNI